MSRLARPSWTTPPAGISGRHSTTGAARSPDCRPRQAVADLEFILAVRDQFQGNMIRAVYHALAAAYAALGQDDRAAKAAAGSGMSSAPAEARLQFGGGPFTELMC
jgi:hypothetical protein